MFRFHSEEFYTIILTLRYDLIFEKLGILFEDDAIQESLYYYLNFRSIM